MTYKARLSIKSVHIFVIRSRRDGVLAAAELKGSPPLKTRLKRLAREAPTFHIEPDILLEIQVDVNGFKFVTNTL